MQYYLQFEVWELHAYAKATVKFSLLHCSPLFFEVGVKRNKTYYWALCSGGDHAGGGDTSRLQASAANVA